MVTYNVLGVCCTVIVQNVATGGTAEELHRISLYHLLLHENYNCVKIKTSKIFMINIPLHNVLLNVFLKSGFYYEQNSFLNENMRV